jgi:hypothetical protein
MKTTGNIKLSTGKWPLRHLPDSLAMGRNFLAVGIPVGLSQVKIAWSEDFHTEISPVKYNCASPPIYTLSPAN